MMPPEPKSRRLRAFLCYASDDRPAIRRLYQRLSAEGVEPWMDSYDLRAGQDWQLEVRQAVTRSDVVLVCLSQSSIGKTGFVQKEIRFALDAADERPGGAVFLIPVRLEDCRVPNRLSHWHWVDYFLEGGFDRLIQALQWHARSSSLILEAQMVFVPSGNFQYGSPSKRTSIAKSYWIDKFPVTNAQFCRFLDDQRDRGIGELAYIELGLSRIRNQAGSYVGRFGYEDHPVVGVTYFGAMSYAKYIGKRLPTDYKWERQARGVDGREYPWGNDFSPTRCNTSKSKIKDTTPVYAYAAGASPYGCYDMYGNVFSMG
jgi:hypothetical protein